MTKNGSIFMKIYTYFTFKFIAGGQNERDENFY